MNLRHYLIAITLSTVSMALPGQHPNYQKNLENTWNQPLSEVFGEPIHRVVPAGSWTLTASINPDYVGNPAFFHLQGSYREKGGTFLYREVIVSLSQQVALLRTAHPDWSDEEIARHLLFAELRFHGVDQLPQEGKAFMKAIRETRGPILPLEPGLIYLHPTFYTVRSHTSSGLTAEYTTLGWRGDPNDLEAALQKGIQEEPLVILLNRLRKSYLSKWKEELRQDGYAGLLNQMDREALGMALFEWACWEKELPLIEKLLDYGLPPNKPGLDGSFPLIAACTTGDRSVVQKLLDAGAKLDTRDPSDRTPLVAACGTGNAELVEWLIHLGAKVEFPKGYDFSNPVLAALQQTNLRLVQSVFMAAGPIPDQLKRAEEVDLVSQAVDTTVVSWLLAQGCKPTSGALASAIHNGSIETMRILLDAGVDPNVQVPFGTPLFFAVQEQNLSAVELLLSKGADPRVVIPNRQPSTALGLAHSLANKAIVETLEKSQASKKSKLSVR